MSAPPPTPIGYAPRPSPASRMARRWALPVTLLLVLGSAYWWVPPVWDRIQLTYWYARCGGYEAPDRTVVWEMRNTGVRGIFRVDQRPHVPGPWQKFYTKISPPGFQSDGTAFLGARQTPGGQRVLVAIDVTPQAAMRWLNRGGRDPEFHIRAFRAGGMVRAPVQWLDTRRRVSLPSYSHVQLFAGSPDPEDPTHFTIPFVANEDEPGVIDGWVREDGIQLELRPPATPPLPASPG